MTCLVVGGSLLTTVFDFAEKPLFYFEKEAIKNIAPVM
jgi:hypothetical protein